LAGRGIGSALLARAEEFLEARGCDRIALTHNLTLSAARVLAERNPGLTFCYVSGKGTSTTERGRFMWARVKGKTENDLLGLPFKAYMFRPGFIQPRKGVRSKTTVYQAAYDVLENPDINALAGGA